MAAHGKIGPRRTTKEQRDKRRVRLASYIRRSKSLPEAKALAAEDGVVENTSSWLTALGDVLASRAKEKELANG